MADLDLVQHDTYPTRFQLSDAAGAVDLTNTTAISLFLKPTLGGTVITVSCTKDADQVTNKGWASANWGATDLNNTGTYDVEVQVTFTGGKIATFPTSGTKTANVRADLA